MYNHTGGVKNRHQTDYGYGFCRTVSGEPLYNPPGSAGNMTCGPVAMKSMPAGIRRDHPGQNLSKLLYHINKIHYVLFSNKKPGSWKVHRHQRERYLEKPQILRLPQKSGILQRKSGTPDIYQMCSEAGIENTCDNLAWLGMYFTDFYTINSKKMHLFQE